MKFNTFMTLCENKMKNGGIVEFIMEHIKDEYVPIEEKQARSETIVKNTMYEKNNDGEQVFHVNSVANHIFTTLSLIDMYTDVEIEFKNALEQYNKMKKNGVLDMILSNINKPEMEEFKMIHAYTINDVMTNEYEGHAFVKSQVERFGKLIGFAIEPFIDKINTSDILEALKNYQT